MSQQHECIQSESETEKKKKEIVLTFHKSHGRKAQMGKHSNFACDCEFDVVQQWRGIETNIKCVDDFQH